MKRPDRVRADWLAGVRSATLRTLASPAFLSWLQMLRRQARGYALVQLVAERLEGEFRYDFRGAEHPTADFDLVRQRGWGACQDAVAIAAAVTVAERIPATLAIEAPDGLPFYSHIYLLAPRPGGVAVVVDPFESKRAQGRGTVDYSITVAKLLRRVPETIARVSMTQAEAVRA